jgi:thymidylate kinase
MEPEKSFEERGEKILHYLRSDLRYNMEKIPRPRIIELTGTPDAGKTTTIEQLDDDFRKINFRVKCPLEGAREIRHIDRTTPLYNIRTGLYALDLLIDYTAGHLYDLVIFDRCVFDAYVWMMYWLEKGQLNEEEKALIQKFFLSRFWINKVDVVWFMVCRPEEALKRYKESSQTKRLGETSNPKTIQVLYGRYRAAYDQLKPQYSQLNFLDTTELSKKEMVDIVASRTLEILEHTIKKTR